MSYHPKICVACHRSRACKQTTIRGEPIHIKCVKAALRKNEFEYQILRKRFLFGGSGGSGDSGVPVGTYQKDFQPLPYLNKRKEIDN